MKTYSQLIEANNNYLKNHPKQNRYNFKRDYLNGFLSETDAEGSLFDYGFVSGHKQATAEQKNVLNNSLLLGTKASVSPDKEKLLRLIYNMPFWADSSYRYLHDFIIYGMMTEKPLFPINPKYETEIRIAHAELEEKHSKQKAEEEAKKPKLSDEEIQKQKSISEGFIRLSDVEMKIKNPEIYDFLYKVAVTVAVDANINLGSDYSLPDDEATQQLAESIRKVYKTNIV